MDNDAVYKALLLRKELLSLPHLDHLNAIAEMELKALNLDAKDEVVKMKDDMEKKGKAEADRLAKEKFDREQREMRMRPPAPVVDNTPPPGTSHPFVRPNS